MIVTYINGGNAGYAYALIGVLLANLSAQALWVVIQNIKKSKWELFRELLYLVTMVAPGVHAARVAKGSKEQDPTDAIAPGLMLLAIKVCDIL